jgi:Skp family chaperone for outer membrane proteins
MAGVAAVGLAAYLGSKLWAQPQPGAAPAAGAGAAAPAAQPLRTRVALINLSKIIKEYQKFAAFREQFKTEYKVYEDKLNALNKQGEALRAEQQNPKTTPERREQIERDIKNLQRQGQDINDEMKATLGKREGDMLVIIYKEIQQAAQFYARARDIELVLHYNDVTGGMDPFNPLNVQRKLTTDGLTPLYETPGMDITDMITQMLNDKYRRDMQTTAAPAAAPNGAGAAPRQ